MRSRKKEFKKGQQGGAILPRLQLLPCGSSWFTQASMARPIRTELGKVEVGPVLGHWKLL